MLTGGGIIGQTLDTPTPFAAADVIVRDPGVGDRVAFHYAIVEVAARVEDPTATPVAADDVDEVRWVRVHQLQDFPGKGKATTSCLHHTAVLPLYHGANRQVDKVVVGTFVTA